MRIEPTAAQQRSARTAFAAMATAPAAARSFVRDCLGSWKLHGETDTAELVTSELVTNAVKASAAQHDPHTAVLPGVPLITVDVRVDGRVLRIAVQDSGSGRPIPRAPGDDAESGRGLLLVTALCTRWDVAAVAGGGKVVRAELTLAEP